MFSEEDRGGGAPEPDADFVVWLRELGQPVRVISHQILDDTPGRVI